MVSAVMSSAGSLLIALHHSGGASCCPHPPLTVLGVVSVLICM